jgi:phage-related protein
LGTADIEYWHCPGIRRLLLEIPQAAINKALGVIRLAFEMWEVLSQPNNNFLLALYPNQYNHSMKPVRFLGDSLERLREFPADAKYDVGYQLEQVQRGNQPSSFKSMPSIGKGVEEIRLRDDSGIYRIIYTARLVDTVYVLHAFQKKTRSTAKRDIDLAKERFQQLGRTRK